MASPAEPPSAGRPAGFAPDRIVHLHPSARCNLACSHCYSESGPSRRDALDAEAIVTALTTLRGHGYSHVSVSGGEPLMYPQLFDVVSEAKHLGYRVTMITNGLLVSQRHEALLQVLDGVAVSFDGMAQSHNAVRGRHDAFQRATAAVQWLSAAGIRVAAAVSVSRSTIPELPDLVDHLAALGTCAVQIRPVAMAGRAATGTSGANRGNLSCSSADLNLDSARLFLISIALRHEFPHIRIRCDLAPASALWNDRSSYQGLLQPELAETSSLAQLVNPLVITETGILKPIAYDFDPRFDIASLTSLSDETINTYKATGIDSFRELMKSAIQRLEGNSSFVDWFDDCTRLSHRLGAASRSPAAPRQPLLV